MKITYKLLLDKIPFRDIIEVLGIVEGYEATLPEFIIHYCSHLYYMQDKEYLLQFLCDEKIISRKDLRLFAVWCVRQIEYLLDDERSINALNIAEKFANGEATSQELYCARDLAWRAFEESDTFNVPRMVAASTLWLVNQVAGLIASYVTSATEFNNSFLMDTIIDKLLEFFTAKENNQEFSWSD